MFDDPSHLGVTILGSGSKGNATLIHCGHDAILIDAGFSRSEFKKRMALAQLPQDLQIRAILVTHEHADHVKGLRVCSEALNVPVYATRRCADSLRSHDSKLDNFMLIAPGGAFSLYNFNIVPFSIPHDAVDPVAFTVTCGNYKVGVATDVGNGNNLVAYELRDCDTLVLESNHDLNMLAASQRPWPLKQRIMGNQGHLSNVAAADLLQKVITHHLQHLVLAHISHECNRPEIAFDCTAKRLAQLDRKDIELSVADQDQPLQTVWL